MDGHLEQTGDDQKLMTRREAAVRLQIGLRTLDRRLAEGDIRCYRLGNGPRPPVRISETQLAEYLERADSGGRQRLVQQARVLVGR